MILNLFFLSCLSADAANQMSVYQVVSGERFCPDLCCDMQTQRLVVIPPPYAAYSSNFLERVREMKTMLDRAAERRLHHQTRNA
jgi:hypothetical protein